jgi:hypothetical protein
MSNEQQRIERNIRMRAYLLWELEGRQEGWATRYWHRARELIDDESRSCVRQAVQKRFSCRK